MNLEIKQDKMESLSTGDIFEKWFDKTQNKGAKQSEPRSDKSWTWKKFHEFNAIPIEVLLKDPYFFGTRGTDLYPCHRHDIIELYKRKEAGEDIKVFVDDEGIGAGKTWKFSLINAIFMFKNIIIPDFSVSFGGLSKDTRLGSWLTSRTKTHGQDVIFKEAMMVILQSGFFIDHFPPQVTLEEVRDMKRNPSVLKFHGDKMAIGIGSAHLGELLALGYSLVIAGIDEANFYPVIKQSTKKLAEADRGEVNTAQDVFRALYNRIESRMAYQGRWPRWALIQIFSSAAYDGDITSSLIKQVKEGRKDIFVRERATWEAKRMGLSGKTFKVNLKKCKIVDDAGAKLEYEKLTETR